MTLNNLYICKLTVFIRMSRTYVIVWNHTLGLRSLGTSLPINRLGQQPGYQLSVQHTPDDY